MRRILLDENMPRRLARLINGAGGDATSFPNDWKRLSDRDMLDWAESQGFGLLVTADKNMRFQQSLAQRKICVVVVPTSDRKAADVQAVQICGLLDQFIDGRFMLLDAAGRLHSSPI